MTVIISFGMDVEFSIQKQRDKMQLTMTGEYALRAMLYICAKPKEHKFQISDVAARNDIPESFLRKILPMLQKAGILVSRKGNNGGISLALPAEEISPLMIIEAVEGEIGLNKCLINKEFCSRTDHCQVHVIWEDAQKELKAKLSSKSMKELAERNS